MSKELLYITVPPLVWLLWTAGGTFNKAFRRLGVPLLILTVCLLMKTDFIIAFIVSALSFAAYTLGYGGQKSWLFRGFAGCCYAISLIPLGLHPILLTIPVTFLLTFWLSRRFNSFSWKVSEGLTSLSIALSLCVLLNLPK